jgi:hypothetical protein
MFVRPATRRGTGHELSSGCPCAGLGRVEFAAVAVVGGILLGERLRFPQRFESFVRAEATIGVAAPQELLARSPVQLDTLRLAIRCVRSAHVGTLVPVQSEPPQSLDDRAF